ncbi:acyl carrier protein [Streptomyces sp. URMC 123]|uniref:acyl carrier protein n=1 Tax=Streptomyces sp. URMC 123 TaxID=3423403 RepID=UPI003F1A007F
MADDLTPYRMITDVLCRTFALSEEELRPDASFDELGLDSLALAELAVTVEDETGHRLDGITAGHTLAQAAETVAARLATGMAGTTANTA